MGVASPKENGRTIEGDRDRWGESLRERMLAGEERGIRIINKEREWVLSLPALSGHRFPRAPEARLDPLGRIYTSRWDPKDVFPINGKLTIESPQNYFHIRSRGERHVDLANLLAVATSSRPVVELIFGKIEDSIETAIRQQFHILEGYKPGTAAPELEQVKKAVAFAQSQSLRFIGEHFTKDNLGSLLDNVSYYLKEIGFLSPGIRQPEKKKMEKMLLRAFQLDKLDRVNPLVSRIRLRSAYLAGIKRMVASSLIIEKAEDNLRLLSWEREMTRWALEMALDDLANFVGLRGRRGPVAFWKKEVRVSEGEIKGMIKVLEYIAGKRGLLSVPRVVDYVGPAKLAAINLLGVSSVKDVDLARQIIGSEESVNGFLRLPPVPVLLYKRQFAKARDRVRWSCGIINAVLADYASIEKAP